MGALTPPVGAAALMLAIVWVPFPILTLLLFLRLYVRISIRSLGLDDYLMLMTWILETILSIVGTLLVTNGGGRHIYDLTPDQIEAVLKYLPINETVGIMTSAFGKTSVAFLMLRIIGPTTVWRKWFLYINIGLYIILSIVSCVFTFVRCDPARALWQLVPTAKCWAPRIFADVDIFQSAYGTFIDFLLVLLPISIVWNLKMNMTKKVGLCALLGTGIFTGICSAIKTAQLHVFAAKADVTWTLHSVFFWATLEKALLIVCGCIPTLKPLYDQLASGKPMTPRKNPYQNSTTTSCHSSPPTSSLSTTRNSTNNVTIPAGLP